jgi:hypothetical protein
MCKTSKKSLHKVCNKSVKRQKKCAFILPNAHFADLCTLLKKCARICPRARVCVCVCVRARAHACAGACVHACARARARVRARARAESSESAACLQGVRLCRRGSSAIRRRVQPPSPNEGTLRFQLQCWLLGGCLKPRTEPIAPSAGGGGRCPLSKPIQNGLLARAAKA